MEIRGGIVGGSKNLFGILHHKLLLPTYNRALKPFVFLCAIHFLSTILLLQKKSAKEITHCQFNLKLLLKTVYTSLFGYISYKKSFEIGMYCFKDF